MLRIDAPAVDAAMSWPAMIAALREGHRAPKPDLGDTLLRQGHDAMLVRAAWIAGLGSAVTAVTIYPGNKSPIATIQGTVLVFDKDTGGVVASIDAVPETRWKTAGDSALGSALLSRPNVQTLLMIGAGTMAEPLVRAHCAARQGIGTVLLWNRSRNRAEALAARLGDLGRAIKVADDLAAAAGAADLISAATMSTEPILRGAWLKPGTHVDLVGAYRPDMREADDDVMRRGRVFVDYRGTTIEHIGELTTPIASGVLAAGDVRGDLYDLCAGAPGRRSDDDITVYKNGGGAHLDLMTALAIVDGVRRGGHG